jgi:hypothetical protein
MGFGVQTKAFYPEVWDPAIGAWVKAKRINMTGNIIVCQSMHAAAKEAERVARQMDYPKWRVVNREGYEITVPDPSTNAGNIAHAKLRTEHRKPGRKRSQWSMLKEATQQRYLRAGITPEQYDAGKRILK